MPPVEPYQTDLAYIHDTGYGDFARKSAAVLLQIIGEIDVDSQCVVDLGGDSGIWARILTDSGYDVLGIDISASMLDIARQRFPKLDFSLVHSALFRFRFVVRSPR